MKADSGYTFEIVPPFNFKEKKCRKPIENSKITVKIKEINNFIYLSETYKVLVCVEYEYPAWPPFGLIYMSLVDNSCSLYSSH